MNKSALFFLRLTAFLLLLTAGCTTRPEAAPQLSKYAPEATEENCILKWEGNLFKLHPNRQYAVFNGTPVQLPVAPVYGEDKVYSVTPVTLKNIIEPLMTGNIPRRKIKRILIDPGHGGHDLGAPGKISREKNLNLLLAQEIRDSLQRSGFQAFLTRSNDTFIPLKNRAALVRKFQADLFISVHHNASKSNPLAAGIECFAHRTPRPEDTLLAALVQQELIRATGSTNRGVKFANFAVLRSNPAPAILIEAGFITNAEEEKRLADPNWRRKAAQAVTAAVTIFSLKSQGH